MDAAEDKVKSVATEDNNPQTRCAFSSLLPFFSLHVSSSFTFSLLVPLLTIVSSNTETTDEQKTVVISPTTDEGAKDEKEAGDGEYVSLQEEPSQGDTKVDLTHNGGFI